MIKTSLFTFFMILSTSALSGEIYTANGDVNLRIGYPKFPFYQNAKIIGVVEKGEKVTVLEKRNVFIYNWLRVQLSQSQKTGWVYNGKSKKTPYFINQEDK